jgi:hypothetical protein
MWGPKTVWKAGETGDRGIEQLNFAVRGIDADRDIKEYVITIEGANNYSWERVAPQNNLLPQSFTRFIGNYNLTSLTAGTYTAKIYAVDTAGRKSNTVQTEFKVQDAVTPVGTAPVLSDFITLANADSKKAAWNPKTTWKAGGKGDTEISQLNTAIKGTDTEKDMIGYVRTMDGKTVYRVLPKFVDNPNFTWFFGDTIDLSHLSPGTYTSTIYVVDTAGNKSNEKTATFTVVP